MGGRLRAVAALLLGGGLGGTRGQSPPTMPPPPRHPPPPASPPLQAGQHLVSTGDELTSVLSAAYNNMTESNVTAIIASNVSVLHVQELTIAPGEHCQLANLADQQITM